MEDLSNDCHPSPHWALVCLMELMISGSTGQNLRALLSYFSVCYDEMILLALHATSEERLFNLARTVSIFHLRLD